MTELSRRIKQVRDIRWANRDETGLCRRCEKPALLPTRSCARHQLIARLKMIEWKYGLTYQQYQELVERYNGRCHICLQVPRIKGLSTDRTKVSTSLSVDHDHKTGEVRGLLCSHCNGAIGWFRDNPVFMQAAIQYLKG